MRLRTKVTLFFGIIALIASVSLTAVISRGTPQPTSSGSPGRNRGGGSAGPRRFRLPISVGELTVRGRAVQARTVDLGA